MIGGDVVVARRLEVIATELDELFHVLVAQGVTEQGGTAPKNLHPVEIFARAYGLIED